MSADRAFASLRCRVRQFVSVITTFPELLRGTHAASRVAILPDSEEVNTGCTWIPGRVGLN